MDFEVNLGLQGSFPNRDLYLMQQRRWWKIDRYRRAKKRDQKNNPFMLSKYLCHIVAVIILCALQS